MQGPSTIDTFSIISQAKTGATLTPIDSIDNDTDGEVVNVQAQSIGDFTAQTIGLAKSHTGVDKDHSANAVEGSVIQDNGGAGAATGTTGDHAICRATQPDPSVRFRPPPTWYRRGREKASGTSWSRASSATSRPT